MFTHIKGAGVPISGFDRKNRDTGRIVSMRFNEQLATDLKMDLVICQTQYTQPSNTA